MPKASVTATNGHTNGNDKWQFVGTSPAAWTSTWPTGPAWGKLPKPSSRVVANSDEGEPKMLSKTMSFAFIVAAAVGSVTAPVAAATTMPTTGAIEVWATPTTANGTSRR